MSVSWALAVIQILNGDLLAIGLVALSAYSLTVITRELKGPFSSAALIRAFIQSRAINPEDGKPRSTFWYFIHDGLKCPYCVYFNFLILAFFLPMPLTYFFGILGLAYRFVLESD